MSCAAAARRSARTMKAAVLYHYPCPDGAFAALAEHLYLSAMSMEESLSFPNTLQPNSRAFSSGLKDLKFQYDVGLNPSLFQRAVNSDSISELRSELGHQFATKSRSLNLRGIGGVVYGVLEFENDQMLKISLRRVDTEDTTPIAQELEAVDTEALVPSCLALQNSSSGRLASLLCNLKQNDHSWLSKM